MSEKITITRKSKLGFGYSAFEKSHRDISAPTHTGTILQVENAISDDRTLASFQHGTAYVSCWFVRANGEWRRIINDGDWSEAGSNRYEMSKLTSKIVDDKKYDADSVTVEVE